MLQKVLPVGMTALYKILTCNWLAHTYMCVVLLVPSLLIYGIFIYLFNDANNNSDNMACIFAVNYIFIDRLTREYLIL
jgi:hypothetical protein